MAEANDTPRPLSPAAEERTPLLPTGADEASAQPGAAEQIVPPPLSDEESVEVSVRTDWLFSVIKITTSVSLASSIICLVLLLATMITDNLSPYGGSGLSFEILIIQLGMLMLVSTILSILNLSTLLFSSRYPSNSSNFMYPAPRSTFFWLPVNLVMDFLFVIFIWGIAGRLSEVYLPNHCSHYAEFSGEGCQRWWLAIKILSGADICAAVIVGLAHLLLFVVRSLAPFRSGSGSGSEPGSQPAPLNFSIRGLTIQFTIKFLGPERGRESEDVN